MVPWVSAGQRQGARGSSSSRLTAFALLLFIGAVVPCGALAGSGACHNSSYFCAPYESRGRQATRPLFDSHGHWNKSEMAFSAVPGFCFASGISHDSAVSCLRDQHILFIGDSVTRFQYIAFVHFIHKGTWIPDLVEGQKHHLLCEPSWGNWREYLIGSCNAFYPFQSCDVFRSLTGNWRINNTDNRYYFNPEFNINISYIGVHQDAKGHFPMTWHPGPPKSVENFKHDRDYDFQGGYADVARVVREQMGPVDALFVNEGLWDVRPMVFGGKEAIEQLRAFTQSPSLLKTSTRRPVWMTSTPLRGIKGSADGIRELALEAEKTGWEILDRYAIVRSAERGLLAAGVGKEEVERLIFFDQAHTQSWVNSALNEAVLGMLCPRCSRRPRPT